MSLRSIEGGKVSPSDQEVRSRPINPKTPTHNAYNRQDIQWMMMGEMNQDRKTKQYLNPRYDISKGSYVLECTDPRRCMSHLGGSSELGQAA